MSSMRMNLSDELLTPYQLREGLFRNIVDGTLEVTQERLDGLKELMGANPLVVSAYGAWALRENEVSSPGIVSTRIEGSLYKMAVGPAISGFQRLSHEFGVQRHSAGNQVSPDVLGPIEAYITRCSVIATSDSVVSYSSFLNDVLKEDGGHLLDPKVVMDASIRQTEILKKRVAGLSAIDPKLASVLGTIGWDSNTSTSLGNRVYGGYRKETSTYELLLRKLQTPSNPFMEITAEEISHAIDGGKGYVSRKVSEDFTYGVQHADLSLDELGNLIEVLWESPLNQWGCNRSIRSRVAKSFLSDVLGIIQTQNRSPTNAEAADLWYDSVAFFKARV